MNKRKDPVQRILDRVEGPLDENLCWETTGYKDKNGYSKVWVHPTYISSHRLMWEVYNGEPVPEGMNILHSCDNPCCVNPNHLSPGTTKENQRQKKVRGRANGVNNKLTERQVKIIKERLKNGESCDIISRDYPVSSGCIYRIRKGDNWSWV